MKLVILGMGMQSILKMLPSVGPFAGMQQAAASVDESQFTRIEAIINGSRRKRIALGSGTTVQEGQQPLPPAHSNVQTLQRHGSMAGGGGMKAQQHLLSQMQDKQKFAR